jgi:hypothetical protein
MPNRRAQDKRLCFFIALTPAVINHGGTVIEYYMLRILDWKV